MMVASASEGGKPMVSREPVRDAAPALSIETGGRGWKGRVRSDHRGSGVGKGGLGGGLTLTLTLTRQWSGAGKATPMVWRGNAAPVPRIGGRLVTTPLADVSSETSTERAPASGAGGCGIRLNGTQKSFCQWLLSGDLKKIRIGIQIVDS